MLASASGHVLFVSPESYSLVFLTEGDTLPAALLSQGCYPLEERAFLVPQSAVGQLPPKATVAADGWRRVAVNAPFANSELLAAASSALAEVEVPVLAWSRTQGLYLFVPQQKLGRALAALRQARLERFARDVTAS